MARTRNHLGHSRLLTASLLLDAVLARTFVPSRLSVGGSVAQASNPFAPFTLNAANPVATLDYGIEVAGYPQFSVSSIDGGAPVQIEVKYSEPFTGLDNASSDGPFLFSQGLANGFRVETFEITAPGPVESFLLQGGQRWQSIRLISGAGVTFDNVAFEGTAGLVDADKMPGTFDSDDQTLNDVWKLGAHAAELSCVDKGSQKAVWQVDPAKGVRLQSVRSSQTTRARGFANYTLSFDALIERGGVWWSVAWPASGIGSGIQLMLTSEQLPTSTFVNTNTTLTPKNTVRLAYGTGFVNQTTLTSYDLDTFTVPFDVPENAWLRLTTALTPDGFLAVSVNDTQVFRTRLADYYVGGSPISPVGNFGFGAWQDQVAWVRNVQAVSSVDNSTVLYQNAMTADDVLVEYGTQANIAGLCLDGPKRDRLVWLGDLLHTVRIMGASTSRFDLEKSTLQFLADTQIANGQFAIAPPMGYPAGLGTEPINLGGPLVYALQDYQLLGMMSLFTYVQQTNDVAFLRDTWTVWQKQIDWVLSNVDASTKLINFFSAFLGPSTGSSAVACAAVQALREMALVSDSVGDAAYRDKAKAAADEISAAVNSLLWNDAAGFYSLSTAQPNDSGVAATAFCLSSGVASDPVRAARSIAALDSLKLGPGYKDTSLVGTDPATNISPNTNGFLLDALLAQPNGTAAGSALIRSLWPNMLSTAQGDRFASGASWEYLTTTGEPGLGLYTSLAHPWGGAPTYALTQHAAGIRAAEGTAGFGYASWVVDPEVGMVDLGLKRASAQVQTPGGVLSVDWKIKNSCKGRRMLMAKITAPAGTKGVFKFGNTTQTLEGETEYSVSVAV